MKSFSLFASLLVLVLTIAARPLPAQTSDSASINTRKVSHHSSWMKAQVIHADSVSIIVHEIGNERMVHTFTYGANLKDKMQRIVDAGGYRSGDAVKILYKPDTTVALKIHGKPSKPS